MARFRFEPAPRRRAAATPAWVSHSALRALELQDAEEAPKGPGWFDSSWELESGLAVSEGLPGDAGLYEWLAVALRE